MQTTSSVLIIGGSLVGLSAALFLSKRGVPNIVVDKHRGSSLHPRAIGFTEHTMEQFRAAGVADQIPQVAAGVRLRRARVESLAGACLEETVWTPGQVDDRKADLSPCRGAAIAQDRLEPILRDAAAALGSDLRLGLEMIALRQDDAGVTATLRDRASGADSEVSAAYMIAADGAGSSTREALGIGRQGVGHLRTLRSVLFSCPGADAFLDRGVQQFQIEQPVFTGFLTTYGNSRWVLMFDDDRERGEAEVAGAVRAALGRDMPFELITTGRWEMAGLVAEHYASGRVFLAGDAAHQLPPTRGGFGANTGIDDVYNLAWKLQMVLGGVSSPSLLDTYSQERQPIGWLRHQQTFARPDYAGWVGDARPDVPLYSDEAMELGQLVRSTAVIGVSEDLPPAADPVAWAGQPGVRAPHLWIRKDGAAISTIDLFTRGFTVMTTEPGWIAAAEQVAAETDIDLATVLVGRDIQVDSLGAFEAAFGISNGRVSLIRPDGVVAWRSSPDQKASVRSLRKVMQQVAGVR